jgi:hypothetical protein
MKKYAIALFICALLFLMGCEGGEGEEPVAGAPFLGGTNGILVNFENSPPPEVFDGGDFPFDVIVKLKNSGEWDVPKEKVRVKLSGIRAEQFGLIESDLTKNSPDDLPKRQRDATGKLLESPPVFVEFNNLNHAETITGSELTYPIRANVCYRYGTEAVSKLCVRENILNPQTGGVCTINEDKTVYNSGAPVQVSDFSESARASDKVGFSFTVGHQGTGDLYEQDTLCNKERTFEDKVYVKVDIGMPGLSCSGLGGGIEGPVKLFGGSKPITCTVTIPSPSDYELPVTITLGYDYEVGQSTQILVKHSGE